MLPEAAIGRVTIRSGAGGDPAALRRAVARQLAGSDLGQAAGSPAAVLVVRRLEDPLPGRMSSGPSALALDPNWERAVREELDRLRRGAARPERGRVDPAAGAILFEDEAELLACLARSLVLESGPVPWWRAAVARHHPVRSVAAVLGSELRFLPAVLSRLVAWRAAEPVVGAVPEAEARQLLAAMASVMELAPPLRDVSRSVVSRSVVSNSKSHHHSEKDRSEVAEDQDEDSPGVPAPRRGMVSVLGASLLAFPPWHAWYSPPADARLRPAQEALLGVAVTLGRAPGTARSGEFAAAAAAWAWREDASDSRGMIASPLVTEHPARAPLGVGAARGSAAAPREETGSARAIPTSMAAAGAGVTSSISPGDLPPPAASPGTLSERGAAARGTAGASSAPLVDATSASSDAPVPTTPSSPAPSPAPAAWSASPDADPLAALGEGVDTQLGGLMFLLNAMEALDLPACFEPDCGLATEVGAQGTLEALARVLLAGGADRSADPVWTLLARLDGREPGQPPRGEGLRAKTLRLPATWLAPLGAEVEPLNLAIGSDRIVLRAAPGFPIADLKLAQGDPVAVAGAEVARTNRVATVIAHTYEDSPPLELPDWPAPLVRWTGFVAPFLRHRLARALCPGCGSSEGLAGELLEMPARLHATATHLDLVAPLEAVRLPVRLAGLDRSPGWLPHLARVVLFHFK
jgi:hypothetical protein